MSIRTTAPRIFRRKNRFYVRIQVPKSLQDVVGRKEFWKSLGTEHREEALARALEFTKEKRNEFSLLQLRREGRIRRIKSLSDQQQMDLAREAFDLHLKRLEEIRAKEQDSGRPDWDEFVELQRDELRLIEREIVRQGSRHEFVETLTNDILGHNLMALNPDSVEFKKLGRLVIEAALNAQRIFVSRLEGRYLPEGVDPRFVDSASGETRPYEPLARQPEEEAPGSMSIVVLAKRYVESPHKKRTTKTKLALQGYLDVAASIMGPSKDVRSITSADCLHLVEVVRRLPPNFSKLKEFDGLSFEQIAERAERDGMATLSPTGVNNYARTLSAFLNWCHGLDFIPRVPMKLDLVRVDDPVPAKEKRKPFSDQQLQTLFDSEVYSEDQRESALFWVPLIALWNGMRLNEICQLNSEDLRSVDGCHVFDISHLALSGEDTDKRTKNQSSVRVIPVHTRLVEFGLIEFRARRNEARKLFPDITLGADGYYSTPFSKRVNRYFRRIGIHGPKHMLWDRSLDRLNREFSASDHDDGLVSPPGLCMSIGTLYPIAL